MKPRSFNFFRVLCPFCLLYVLAFVHAQTPPAMRRFLNLPALRGASVALMAKGVDSRDTLYIYDANRELTPASVMKLVTTAAALEILGEDYRYTTGIEYDGTIKSGILDGNIYIKGSGDPTLGSSHFAHDRSNYTPDENTFIQQWIDAIRRAGIREIKGNIIADESIFDNEGISGKWVGEDIGSYYGAGSYGLSVFDNLYKLNLRTGSIGSKPEILYSVPDIPTLRFHNYLVTGSADSSYILGYPFSDDRYLYGTIPSDRNSFTIRGDIPDPPLFLASYLHARLQAEGIRVGGLPHTYRLLSEVGQWSPGERKLILSTHSPALRDIVRITNERSHNLYADALLKTLGLSYAPGELISSAGKGVRVVREHWAKKGLNTSSLVMHDGSGLAIADKITASFLCDLLIYMSASSERSSGFIASLPLAGQEGSVANFLKGTALQGRAYLKSGGMSRIRSYAGYIDKSGKRYAVVIIVNNYSGTAPYLVRELEKLLQALF